MKDLPNVLLVVLDTARKDIVYNNLDLFPAIKHLAQEGVQYESTKSTSPWTVPSHASMFTGKYPSEHGMHSDFIEEAFLRRISTLKKGNLTIQEALNTRGYSTLNVSSNHLVGVNSAFDPTFESSLEVGPYYQWEHNLKALSEVLDAPHNGSLLNFPKLLMEYGAKKTLEAYALGGKHIVSMAKLGWPIKKGAREAIDGFIGNKIEQPFFGFINLMEAHEPYTSLLFSSVGLLGYNNLMMKLEPSFFRYFADSNMVPKNSLFRLLKKVRNIILRDLKNLDSNLGALIRHLRERNIYDDTCIIITSDHGQSLGENRLVGHTSLLTDPLVEVPLIVKYPHEYSNVFKSAKKKNAHRSLVDVFDFVKALSEQDYREFPTRDVIFSEVYELNRTRMKELLKGCSHDFRPSKRKRVWKNEYSLTVNGSEGKIEEFTKSGLPADKSEDKNVLEDLLTELSIFSGSEQFEIPPS